MRLIFLLTFFLLFSLYTNAQSGYNGYGNNQSLNYSDLKSREKRTSKRDIEKAKVKIVEKSIEKLKKELNLDELQEIAIKKLIIDDQKSRSNIISNPQFSDKDKMNEINALQEKTEREIKIFLSPEQIEKYNQLKLK